MKTASKRNTIFHRHDGAVVAGILWLVLALSFAGALAKETEGRHFTLDRSAKELNWLKISQDQNQFKIYKILRDAILDGSISAKSIAAFNVIQVGAGERERAAAILNKIFVHCDQTTAAETGSANECASNGLQELYVFFTSAEPNPEVLYDYLATRLAGRFAKAEANPNDKGRHYSWATAYLIDAAMTAYEKTGDMRFLELALESLLKIDANRDDRIGLFDDLRGRVVKSWGTSHYFPEKSKRTTGVTYAGRIGAPMARLAMLISADPHLQKKHGPAALRLLNSAMAAMREHDDEFVVHPDRGYGYYRNRIHDKAEPLNHLAAAGVALLNISALTKAEHWQERALLLARYVYAMTDKSDAGYIYWDYWPTPESKRGGTPEYIWKAHVTVRFMALAEKMGIVFKTQDLVSITKTFRHRVLRGGQIKNINASFSHEFRPLYQRADKKGGFVNLAPFMRLRNYDPALEADLVSLIASDPIFKGWFRTAKTAFAYAVRIPEKREESP